MKLQTSYNNGILTLNNTTNKDIRNLHITFYNTINNKNIKNNVMLYFRNKTLPLLYGKYLVYELDNIPPLAILNLECVIVNNVESEITYNISNMKNIIVHGYIQKLP
jgi:hypothetical protein